MKKSEIEKKTASQMRTVKKFISDKFGDNHNEYDVLLEMFEANFEIMLCAKEDIKSNGIIIQNSRGSAISNPATDIFMKASSQLDKILNQLGISPKNSIKLKLDENKEDEVDFIKALTEE